MSLEQLERYINEIVPVLDLRTNIRIGGGEPTLHPQIFKILDLVMQKIRPLLEIPITFLTNGVGSEVNQTLQLIRKKYDTYDNPHIPIMGSPLTVPSRKQLCINVSKSRNIEAYINAKHTSIFRAPVDLFPKSDWSAKCPAKNSCNITPYGFFVCCGAALIVSTIFKFDEGKDHLLTPEEEKEQKEKLCKYCPYLGASFNPEPTESYKRAIEDWEKDPYFLKVLK
jgi:hypothetical protein